VVLPIHDRNPTRRVPVVTYALVVANVIVFVLSPLAWAFLGGTTPGEACRETGFILHWGAIPKELLSGHALAYAVGGPDVTGTACHAVPRSYDKIPFLSALSAMFLHAGWAHLLGNMLYLLIFGNNVEDRMGRLRYLLFYLACGLAATYGFALLSPNSVTPLLGASGAIAGVLGAYLVMYPRARVWSLVPFLFFIPLRLPAWLVLGMWFVLQWIYASGAGLTAGAGVAYTAHVIGFLLGVVVAAVFYGRQPPPASRQPPYRVEDW
jgi:membrane associated rhomboid family serine protease